MSKELLYSQRQVLAHIILENELYFNNQNKLVEDAFPEAGSHEVIKAFRKIVNQGDKADLLSVSKELNGKDSFSYVTALLSEVNYDIDIDNAIYILYNDYRLRLIQKIITNARAEITKEGDASDIFNSLHRELLQAESSKDTEIKPFSVHLDNLLAHIGNNATKSGISGLSTGFSKFDSFSGGLQPTNLIVVAGATSQGKTSLALSISKNMANPQTPVAFLSLEMSCIELCARITAMDLKISSKELLKGILPQDRQDWLKERTIELAKLNIFIDDVLNTNVEYVLGMMRKYIIQKGVKFFVVDYLQLLRNQNRGQSREERIADNTRLLKNFAKETNTTVMLLSQMNREKDGRNSPEPKLSDLRGSGEIEETADIVGFMYRPEYYGIQTFTTEQGGGFTKDKALFIVAKGRSIGTGVFRMRFNSEIPLFTDDEYQF